MSEDREPSGGRMGLLAVGMVACCGLPLLLGAGIAVGVTGLAVGSGLVVAAGVVLAVWGWRRRQARRCEIREPNPRRTGMTPDGDRVP